MSLDLDRLEKLVRLACNNQNENEANLAARRACKMLLTEAGVFKIRRAVKAVDKVSGNWTATNGPTSNSPIWKDVEEMIRKAQEDFKNPFTEPTTNYEWGYNRPTRSKYNPDQKKTLICTKCRQPISTAYVGHPGTFICTPCYWKDV